MRHITQIDPNKLQQEEKYQIRKRADALLDKWQKFVQNVSAAEEGRGAIKEEAVNGSILKVDSKAEVKNKPKSESGKVSGSATKPASDANGVAEASDKTTAMVVEETSVEPLAALTKSPEETTGVQGEQAMDTTD